MAEDGTTRLENVKGRAKLLTNFPHGAEHYTSAAVLEALVEEIDRLEEELREAIAATKKKAGK